jgi:hypothetical protein
MSPAKRQASRQIIQKKHVNWFFLRKVWENMLKQVKSSSDFNAL